jgi:hypothetical protein
MADLPEYVQVARRWSELNLPTCDVDGIDLPQGDNILA